jgi:aspartate racemase
MIPLPRSREEASQGERSLGVIAGLEPAPNADFLLKLTEASEAPANKGRFNVVLEQRAAARAGEPRTPAARQLFIFDTLASFAQRGVSSVVLPCFSSLAILDELGAYSPLPIASLPAALLAHIQGHLPGIGRVGIVTSEDLRAAKVFERHFPQYELLYSRWEGGDSPESFRDTCVELASRGAQLIIPGLSALVPVAARIGTVAVPVLDPHRIYANHVVSEPAPPPPERPFKLGVVGGVGPAATVDFLQKVLRHTPAHRDQDHLKLLVEQNPQIPDRTAHLIGQGPDPTLALYATCRKLQAGEADLIAIPCNTAHAFIDLIQPHLDIPILNMLTVTVGHVRESWPTLRKVGLLATTGTLSTGIYHRALQKQGLRPIVPPPSLQARMMEGIYGPRGIKAGFTSGPCVEDIRAVIEELVQQGVEVIILGCTELPLIFPERDIRVRDRLISLVDPTEILARRCIAHAMTHSRR